MQGAEKISPRRIWCICKQEIFYATQQLGYNEVAVKANLQVMPELKSGFLEVHNMSIQWFPGHMSFGAQKSG